MAIFVFIFITNAFYFYLGYKLGECFEGTKIK